ncbi:NYN domain-containing protein [Patescibacteria group bacterium]|nr:NYN domain-containing protein [Patescibacteria group bacterium]MBU4480799.1 NYN domain-containing protein [Patescibacteria group bacterium]
METEIFKFKLKDKTFVIVDWANVYGWFSDPNSKTYLGWEVDPKKLFTYLKSYPNITDINFYFGVESNKPKSVTFKEEIENIGYSHKSKEVKWVPAVLETTAHFKVLVRRLFDVLDNVKNTNSAVSNRLYDLVKRLEKVLESGRGTSAAGEPAYTFFDEEQVKAIYELIEGLDSDLRKLNIDITELQASLKEPVQRRKCDFDVEISRDIYNNLENFEIIIIFSGDGDYATLAEDLILKGKKVIVVFAPGHKGKEYEDFKIGLFLCSAKKLKQFIAK